LAAFAATGAVAAAAGLFGPQNLSEPSPLGPARTIPTSLAASFAPLRRVRRASDALPANALPEGTSPVRLDGTAVGHYGINLTLSRVAGDVGGETIWLVPGSTGVCAFTEFDGFTCEPNLLAVQHGLVFGRVVTSGAPSTTIGVVPDGATVTAVASDGTSHQVALSGNVFKLRDGNIAKIAIRTVGGTAVVAVSSPGG
jgi:hypothetical protein